MYRKLLCAMVFLLVMALTLAAAVEEKPARNPASVPQENVQDRIARLLKESETPEAIQARKNVHHYSMMYDPIYRKQYEEYELMKNGNFRQLH